MTDAQQVEDLARYARRIDRRATKRPRFRKVKTTFRFPVPLLEEIDRRADYLGMTRNAFVLWAVQRTLKDRYGKAMISYLKSQEEARARTKEG